MKILEILLPKSTADRDLPAHVVRKIDALQQRMDTYVDKIMDPNTSKAGVEFLKSRLRDDYYELRDTIPGFHSVAEETADQFEVVDSKTGKVVGGPYATRSRAIRRQDQLDNQYGAYRYRVRRITPIKESITRLPLTDKDFGVVIEMMKKPIPAVIAPLYIHEIIEDDELNAELDILVETDPGRDVRPLIAEWFKKVMPDQIHRFTGTEDNSMRQRGTMSPIHGYDPRMYKGTSDPVTGDAFGSF